MPVLLVVVAVRVVVVVAGVRVAGAVMVGVVVVIHWVQPQPSLRYFWRQTAPVQPH